MKKFYLVFIGLVVCSGLRAQTWGWIELGWPNDTFALYPSGYNYYTINAICNDANNNLYVGGYYYDSTGSTFIMKWDGSHWTQLGNFSSLGNNITVSGISSICSYNGSIYAAGSIGSYNFNNDKFYVVQWDGSTWSTLGPINQGFNEPVTCICLDAQGTIYAAGEFMDSTGKFYVASWNGSNWVEVGTGLNANSYINAVCVDDSGNIYAGGEFTDSFSYYVAKLSPAVSDTWQSIGEPGDIVNSIYCNYDQVFVGTESNLMQYISNIPEWVPIVNGSVPNIASDPEENIYFVVDSLNGNSAFCPVQRSYSGSNNFLSTNNLYGSYHNNNTPLAWVDTNYNIYVAGDFLPNPDQLYVTVKKYVVLLDASIDTIPSVCAGSIIAINSHVSGYFPPFTYHWAALSGDSLSCNACVNPIINLTQNSSYKVTVTDAQGYTATASVNYTVNSNIDSLNLSLVNIPGCTADSVTITLTGGTSPFSITWGDTTSQTGITNTVNGHDYFHNGNYPISVSDSSGCITSLIDTILFVSTQLVLNIPAGCLNNGELQVMPIGGTPPYTFNWSNGDTGSHIINLAHGNYTVTVTDANNCTSASTDTVNYVTYYVFLTANNANCGNNGAITTSVSGGTAPYTYSWSNSDTSANLSGLAPASYYVTVTDNTGCQSTGNTTISGGCSTIISGIIFIDTTGNCNYTGNSTVVPNATLTLTGAGQTQYANTDLNGRYTFNTSDTGSYQVNIYTGNSFACGNFILCGQPNPVIVDSIGVTITNYNFAMVPSDSSFDLYLHPGWSSANPGFEKDYWIYFGNNSPTPFTGTAIAILKYDSNLIYLSSDIPYTTYSAANDSITWVVSNVVNTGWNYIGKVRFKVPSTLSPDYLLKTHYRLLPLSGDCDTVNNDLEFAESCRGAKDPNEKVVSPSGSIYAADSLLTYTIYFQNTGTDSTHFIIVKDTLSPYLNPATVRNLASSNNYSDFNISGSGILTWTFNPLRLPDSSTNALTSKGFIMFSVKKNSDISTGIPISNSASIYFDYNNAVVTDTVTDTICNAYRDTLTASICAGTTYIFNGDTLRNFGAYSDTFTSVTGCDSIITLLLTVNPTYATVTFDTICQGVAYNFYGRNLTGSGVYTDTVITVGGCDSVVGLVLYVIPSMIDTMYANICAGGNYTFNGNNLSNAGNYFDTLAGVNGCDSIISLYLTVIQPVYDTISTGLCPGSSYNFNGTTIIFAGTYTDTLTASSGCDSIVTLNAYLLTAYDTSITASICPGTSYNFNGLNISEAGNYIDTLSSAQGCDSITQLFLSLDSLPLITLDTTVPQPGITNIFASPSNAISYFWQEAYDTANLNLVDTTTTYVGNVQVYCLAEKSLNGSGYIRVILTLPDGCTDTSGWIFVDNCAGAINDISNLSNLSLQPNPASDLLNIRYQLSGATNIQINVLDIEGRLLMSWPQAETATGIHSKEIDVSELADGVYILNFQTANGAINRKFVKQ